LFPCTLQGSKVARGSVGGKRVVGVRHVHPYR
jgi:hypothetical protein